MNNVKLRFKKNRIMNYLREIERNKIKDDDIRKMLFEEILNDGVKKLIEDNNIDIIFELPSELNNLINSSYITFGGLFFGKNNVYLNKKIINLYIKYSNTELRYYFRELIIFYTAHEIKHYFQFLNTSTVEYNNNAVCRAKYENEADEFALKFVDDIYLVYMFKNFDLSLYNLFSVENIKDAISISEKYTNDYEQIKNSIDIRNQCVYGEVEEKSYINKYISDENIIYLNELKEFFNKISNWTRV